jgi:uncharacterized protein YjiS (DUF1127 family)
MRTPTEPRAGHGAVSSTRLDPWARHAFASNGFGGASLAGLAPDAPDGDALLHRAHADRSHAMADVLAAVWRAVRSLAQHAYASHQRRVRAREVYDTLRRLDDHMLHDLGLDRSELSSVAAEATGGAEHTRAQTMISTYGLPG